MCAELPDQGLRAHTHSTNDQLLYRRCIRTAHPKQLKQRRSPEIFVDASGRGIGLTIGSKWLAWMFTRNSSMPRNDNGSIDISWAELVAVELGIRTAVATGQKCATITIFSDNQGVVQVMQTRSWDGDGDGKERLAKVMQRINSFCEQHHLNPAFKWIPTTQNPADGPSRGELSAFRDMITSAPIFPKKLKHLLEKTSPTNRCYSLSKRKPDRGHGIYFPYKCGQSILYLTTSAGPSGGTKREHSNRGSPLPYSAAAPDCYITFRSRYHL